MTPQTMELIINYGAPALLLLIIIWKICIPVITLIAEITKAILQIFNEILHRLLDWVKRKDTGANSIL